MTPDALREELEMKIVEGIKNLLDSGSITDAKAQEISQKVLELLTPDMDANTLKQTITKLSSTIPELSSITLPYIKEFDREHTSEQINSIRQFIAQGQYDAAAPLDNKAAHEDAQREWQGTGKPSSD